MFRSESCRRGYRYNHVPTVIGQQQLDRAIQSSGTSREALLSNVEENDPNYTSPPISALNAYVAVIECRQGGNSSLPKKDGGRWVSILPVRRFDLY